MSWLLLLLSAAAAGTMGYAIQRGATCMVAALEEVVDKRRANRLAALLEAAAIVTGGLSLATVAGLLTMPPSSFAVTMWTVAGGVLLGLGAFVARACVFGAIAKLGSGDWAYLAVPLGFFIGCLGGNLLLQHMAPAALALSPPALRLAGLLLLPFGALLLWRGAEVLRAAREGRLAAHVWSPRVATSVIGIAFVVLMLAAGPWSYTEALAQAAAGKTMVTGTRLVLFAALFGGAMIGGWTAGKLSAVPPTHRSLLRCGSGGTLMGMGSVLIPGSNDGLILVGLPMLQPHAWVALASMAMTIGLALLLRRGAAMASAEKMA